MSEVQGELLLPLAMKGSPFDEGALMKPQDHREGSRGFSAGLGAARS